MVAAKLHANAPTEAKAAHTVVVNLPNPRFALLLDSDNLGVQIDLLPAEIGQIAHSLAGVESSENQPAPVRCRSGLNQGGDLIGMEDPGLGFRFRQRCP